jgi:type IV secretory pathway protease TraF
MWKSESETVHLFLRSDASDEMQFKAFNVRSYAITKRLACSLPDQQILAADARGTYLKDIPLCSRVLHLPGEAIYVNQRHMHILSLRVGSIERIVREQTSI